MRSELRPKSLNKESVHKSSERLQKKLNIDPIDIQDTIHVLPSVRDAKGALFGKQIGNLISDSSIVISKTHRKLKHSIQGKF